MNDLNFHHLRYFQTVAHDGNLTRAAERLNVSQSAVSTQIRQLEERLGQKLFERRGRSLILTEAGQIALDHADAIFTTGDETREYAARANVRPAPGAAGRITGDSLPKFSDWISPAPPRP
ncbi:LysR family transcriptional regulator [Jiella pelagia]|uniref:LysR family transcriptional regulator n=1 Tax=Jiella pelagia TaxID=2986949 RepID=UPI002E34BDCB|nr:LysR family transcriptional regulator [Jiella pelagia]